ncbi:FAD-binding oxidoreductase [Poseidonocella sp. HB161398]|uniref:NAD(P)/FAD-dependent oxidoreductase n=1 Tax=Poseidonocella sp. HB161398 TaxID=2320855 RepID=UPI001109D567|nr:FAD-dependent oxidoreductase [Poseidonocella sp. HB161398]
MSDAIVIGGGMVGAAIAWGLLRQGMGVTVLDGADEAQRAARANFGLVWVQSKGDGLPEYAAWTREGAALWPGFQELLAGQTGVSCGFSAPGGLHLCMSEEELDGRRGLMQRMHNVDGPGAFDMRILDRGELADLLPGIGPEVVGASLCAQDGHASPQGLLLALHRGILAQGGRILSGQEAVALGREAGLWQVETAEARHAAPVLVLAAGTGNLALGRMAGIEIPVSGLKGQILVTERTGPRLPLPTHKVRQTEAGTLLLGDSKEPEAGLDDRSSGAVIADIAARSLKMFPWLSEVNLVRAWGGIRTMTPDSFPVYEAPASLPGLFAANCHSGVTLAAVHALKLAPMIAAGALAPEIAALSSRRFDVPDN